ncbi:unnamed protein product [Mycena citricolor]|uniref:Uncharacterized protein n=1 Tax=Mycena citricolor TaxID=2018698 RepID=A0AAD2K6U6_9AGAR|nr:unnamed protein product [Mycena citricolor]
MPLLGGLFGRNGGSSKSKNAPDVAQPTTHPPSTSQTPSSSGSSPTSPTLEYVSFASDRLPSSPNGRSLAYAGEVPKEKRGIFGRKRSGNLAAASGDLEAPRPNYLSHISTSSDLSPQASSSSVQSLRPPQGVFNQSTRSLPHETARRYPSLSPLAPTISPTKSVASGLTTRSTATSKTSKSAGAKSGKKFSFWGSRKSSPELPPSPSPPDFNLQSFRNARDPSPARPTASAIQPLTAGNLSSLGREYENSDLPLVRPRPPREHRGSDASSSRISVSAFREMQAKRSAAGSPALPDSAGGRTPSPGPGTVRLYALGNASGSRSHQPLPQHQLQPRATPPTAALIQPAPQRLLGHQRRPGQWESDDDEVEEEEEESDEGDGMKTGNGSHLARRQRTITKNTARSDLGHGGGLRAASSLGVNGSTASPPSVDMHAKRLSIEIPARQVRAPASSTRPSPSPAQKARPLPQSGSSSSSDSDDAPLATLVLPRRAGSSLSIGSNGSTSHLPASPSPNTRGPSPLSTAAVPRPQHQSTLSVASGSGSSTTSRAPVGKAKPLIDINELTAARPVLASQAKTNDGFTGGGMLAGKEKPSASPSPVLTTRSPPVTNETGLMRFPSPPGSPVREKSPTLGVRETTISRPVVRRDMLSERLKAAAVTTSDSESSRPSVPNPPTSFSPARRAMHRRSSSDIILRNVVPDADLNRDLAALLGGGVALVSRMGEEDDPEPQPGPVPEPLEGGEIRPIPIKQRSPAPGFSVTSRPQPLGGILPRASSAYGDLGGVRPRSTSLAATSATLAQNAVDSVTDSSSANSRSRQRSSTMLPLAGTSPSRPTPATEVSRTTLNLANPATESSADSSSSKSGSRKRSSTMLPSTGSTPKSISESSLPASSRSRQGEMMPDSARQRSASSMIPSAVSSASLSSKMPSPTSIGPPTRPFVLPRTSPASSTGGSSSSPVPPTPRDGSEVGSSEKKPKEWSGGASGLLTKRGLANQKRRSVSFDFNEELTNKKGKAVDDDEKRRERRRSEARAAIELGNVINGRGPVLHDEDEEEDRPVMRPGQPQPMMVNPMMMPMGFGTPSPGWPGMPSPSQFMMPPPADPSFMAAHQQAMMYAKQAYQMAVAQQAMAVAAEEWERGSSVGGFNGGGSIYGGGGGPAMMNPWMGMFPSAPRSMYGGGGGARSDYGGPTSGGGSGWNSSRSVYGETFGPSTERYARPGNSPSQAKPGRDSSYFGGLVPPSSASRQPPRQRTASQPATPSKPSGSVPRRGGQPPSSWKPGM